MCRVVCVLREQLPRDGHTHPPPSRPCHGGPRERGEKNVVGKEERIKKG